jgi:N-acyl-D-amino-acid deacylase
MPQYDHIIRNATIFDGTGAVPFSADIAIKGRNIESIGNISGDAINELDVNKKAVSPGFIDVHTHDDFAAVLYPDMSFKLLGGVTTCVVGNCGMGAAPFPQAAILARAFHPGKSLPQWEGYQGYMTYLDQNPTSINIGVLVGHGTARMAAMGNSRRVPNDKDMALMKSFVSEGLDAGALGLSTGLVYEPGSYADTDEIVELASLMTDTGGLYTTHMRNEGEQLLESIEEALQIGQRAGVPIQISHHKAAGKNSWGKVKDSIKLIELAQAKGIDVHADQYPYTAGSTILSAVVKQGSFDSKASGLGYMSPDDVVVASTRDHPEWQGKSISEMSDLLNLPPQSTAEKILELEPGTTAVLHSMSEDDVQLIMKHTSTMIGSDGIPTLEGKPHPRLMNTFARVLGHYSRDLSLFPLQEAIYKMTGFSAQKFGLTDRGEIREGAFADLVIFDASKIIDRGTYADPMRYPDGITDVFVNGAHVVHDAKLIGSRPGMVIRRS